MREVHFDRESLNDSIDREAADIRFVDRRLATFERIESAMGLHGISKNELLALTRIGMYEYMCSDQPFTSVDDLLVLKLRCSFCRHSYRHAHFGFFYVNLVYIAPDYFDAYETQNLTIYNIIDYNLTYSPFKPK